MTLKTLVFSAILLFNVKNIIAQKYEMKIPVSATERAELLKMEKELFLIHPEFNYNISTSDALKSFDGIASTVQYTKAYLRTCDSLLLTDSINPIYLNNIANYYNFHKQTTLAADYFNSSYKHLKISYFNNDSAFYLSNRGVLKLNLGMENAIDDIERALKIDPTDTFALAFYPFFLISRGEFKKATELAVNALEKGSNNPSFPYTILIMSKAFGDLMEKITEVDSNKAKKAFYAQLEYNQIVDFTLIDKYFDKYKKYPAIRYERYMADICVIILKLVFQDNGDNDTLIFNYSTLEIAKLKELEKHFLDRNTKKELNGYAINKNLGYIYFMLHQWNQSILYFNRANEAFPVAHRFEQFNNAEIYNALLCIYHYNHDTASYRKTLQRKIQTEPEGRKYYKDYYTLALHYLLTDQPIKSKQSALIAKSLNQTDFDVLRLLAHLNYIEGNNTQTEAYAKLAGNNMQQNSQNYELCLQFAIYHLMAGNAAPAYQNIEAARVALEGEACPLCDKLLEKYITK